MGRQSRPSRARRSQLSQNEGCSHSNFSTNRVKLMPRRTMTETLRVQEEVGSLRAIVNTMRMRKSFPSPAHYCALLPPARTARAKR